MEFGTSFNSKLLLFGEYGLMFDAMALSVPFPKFSGKLDFDLKGKYQESTIEIRKFCNHLKYGILESELAFSFDLKRMENDLQKGLWFDSDIPQQYGMGSSGALIAALFSRYTQVCQAIQVSPEILKSEFAILESYFHGRSSGLDPLISFLNKPILINSEKQVLPVDFDLSKSGVVMALIDTHTTGATGPLVKYFVERMNEQQYKLAFEQQFIPANNGCIGSLLNGNSYSFYIFLNQLIHFQLKYFRRMIPEHFYSIILSAISEGVFIKLLGSGGGGFLLVFAESQNILDQWSKKRGIELLKVG